MAEEPYRQQFKSGTSREILRAKEALQDDRR